MRTDGQRCSLRDWRVDDAQRLMELANNPAIARNLRSTFPNPYLLADAEAFIANSQREKAPCHWAIEVDGALAGGISVEQMAGSHTHVGVLGYWLGEPYWGHGIATESVALAVAWSFGPMGLERIQASVLGWNSASARVLEKNGFLLEGTLRMHTRKDGQTADQFIYGLLRDE